MKCAASPGGTVKVFYCSAIDCQPAEIRRRPAARAPWPGLVPPAPVHLAAPKHGDAERAECAVVATKVNPNEACRGIAVDARALRRRNMWTRADRTLAPDSRHIVAFRSSDTTFRAADKSSVNR